MRTESNANTTEPPINSVQQHTTTSANIPQENTYKVIRRNGKLTAFSADKIAIAMTKAFLDVEGKRSATSTSIRDKVTHLTQEVINALFRRSPQGGIVHIEDIQDHVELALMRSGEHKIARSYVLYREQRAQQRAKKEKKTHKNNKPNVLHITTDTGEQKPLDQQRLQAVIEESTTGLKNADASRIMKGALRNLFDGIPESEVGSALIMSARTLIDQDPDYSYVSARLLLDTMRTEALSFTYGHPRECTQQELGTCYAEYFGKYIKKAAELQHLDEELTRYDLKKLGAALEPERDLNFTYLGLQTLYDRYFIHHDQTRFELPQAFFMRVAMGLAINEIHREERAIEFYKLLSSFRFMSSTPTLFNSGSLRPQLSSCYLTTVPDDLAGIYDAIKDNALLSKFAGGLGNDWTPVRGLGSHIKGTNGKSQGVVPFLKVVNDTAVAVNQCFAADTWVYTAEGTKKIKHIEESDVVLGQRGEYRQVKQKMLYNQTDPMVEINVKHSITPLKVTTEHPLWALQDVPMAQATARTMSWLEKGKVKPQWVDAGELQQGDYIAQVIPKETIPVEGFTTDDARLYGILLGDGHSSKEGLEWGVSGNPDNDAHLDFVQNYLTERGIHYWIKGKREKYMQVSWSAGVGLARDATTGQYVRGDQAGFIFSYDELYNAEGKKHIHRRFNHLPKEQTLALIHGLIETDGNVSRGTEISFTNTSQPLIDGLRYQLLRLGVPCAGQYREREHTHTGQRADGEKIHFNNVTKAYDLRIPAIEAIAKPLGCKVLTKQNWLEWNGCLFSRLRSVKSITPTPFVYDLKVEGDHSYMTTNGLGHNGGKRKGAVCAYLETWHIDIEEFLELRKNTGDERRRTHDMNSANWIPDAFMKRVAKEQDWTLFSPDETPDLHDLCGKAFEKRYAEYEAKAARGEMRLFRTIKAVELWRKMLGMLFETGHPWVTFKEPSNIRYTNQHVGVVHSSNLCCMTADQRVVTDKGILTVEELYHLKCQNKVVGLDGIYNASKMLLPRPDAPIVEIQTREGYSHKVTPDHKVWVKDKGWIEAQHLEANDKLLIQQLEGLWGKEHNPELSYSMGLIAGDGTFSKKSVHIDVWEHDFHFIQSIEKKVHNLLAGNTVLNTTSTNIPKFAFNKEHKRARLSSAPLYRLLKKKGLSQKNKTRVPELIWKGDRETVAEYLRGLYQADGHIQAGGDITTLVLASKNLAFIKELQIIWANFGVKTSINKMRDARLQPLPDGKGGTKQYMSQALYRLLITSIQGCQIAENILHLGEYKKSEACEKYKTNLQKKGYQQKLYAHFTHLTPLPNEDAYCLTVDSETHAWTVNGLVTKNTEITLHTNAEEISVCNLGSVNLAAHTTKDGLDMPLLEKTITTATRMLDNVIEYNYYSVPQARRSNLQHRPVGLGLMGFQDALYKLNIPYATEEAVEFADRSMEAISYYAIQGSNQLAEERGKYSTYDGSLWSRGILPIDSIDLLEQERGEFCQIDKSKTLDWDTLREKISTHGMRNSNVMAIAPTACVSGDTLILSSKGLIPIASLVKGEAQWQNININIAQEGNLAHSDQLYLNGFKDTLRITTKRGSEITATPNHRIRVINKEGDYCWKYFFELAVGDEVVRRLGGHQALLATKAPIKLTLPQRIHHNEKNIQLPETLTADTAFILGLYMGDGYLKYSNRGHYTKKEGLGFAIHNDETTLIEQLRDYFSTWGVTLLADVSKTESACTTYMVFSSQLVKWFESNQFNKQRGNFGEGSASAFIPEKILQSNSNVLCAFLSGLFVADGTVNNRCVEMCTVSRTLALQVKTALESLGIIATLSTSKPGTKGNRPAHRVRTSNIESTKKFATLIGFSSSIKQQRLQQRLASCHSIADARRGHNIRSKAIITEFIKAARSANVDKHLLNPLACSKTNGKMNIGLAQQAIADYPALQATKLAKLLAKGNLYFEPIVSIEASQDVTYDLQVPERHTYVANGFVSHNTISNICGVSQSIEPTYQNMYVKSNLSGEFTVVNPYLINELKALNLWDDVMINDLKYFDGSVQKIDRIPENIKEKYATAFEIDSRWLVEAASRRQKWIDQGESLNLYLAEPSGKKLDDLYKLAWVRGLKTTYYLRTLGATHMEKSADSNQVESNDMPKVCSILDPDCEACQ